MWILLCAVALAFAACELVFTDGIFGCLTLGALASAWLASTGYGLPISGGVGLGVAIAALLGRGVIVAFARMRAV